MYSIHIAINVLDFFSQEAQITSGIQGYRDRCLFVCVCVVCVCVCVGSHFRQIAYNPRLWRIFGKLNWYDIHLFTSETP